MPTASHATAGASGAEGNRRRTSARSRVISWLAHLQMFLERRQGLVGKHLQFRICAAVCLFLEQGDRRLVERDHLLLVSPIEVGARLRLDGRGNLLLLRVWGGRQIDLLGGGDRLQLVVRLAVILDPTRRITPDSTVTVH